MKIERLNAGQGARLRELRLRAIQDTPDAFGATWEEVAARSPQDWEHQLVELATFVAVSEGCDVGIVLGAGHDDLPDTAYLLSMWVAPEARRRGVAASLIDAVVNWAKNEKFARLILDVGEQNAPAIALYRSQGFSPNGTIGVFPSPREHIREIQMERKL